MSSYYSVLKMNSQIEYLRTTMCLSIFIVVVYCQPPPPLLMFSCDKTDFQHSPTFILNIHRSTRSPNFIGSQMSSVDYSSYQSRYTKLQKHGINNSWLGPTSHSVRHFFSLESAL